MAPPCAFTPFTVWYSRAVSTSHSSLPSVVEYARRCPSNPPAKMAPGTAVTAAESAGLQRGLPGRAHGTGGAYHALAPSAIRSAVRPPPASGSRVMAVAVLV